MKKRKLPKSKKNKKIKKPPSLYGVSEIEALKNIVIVPSKLKEKKDRK